MNEYTFRLEENEAYEVVLAVAEKVDARSREMLNNMGNLSKIEMHTASLLKTAGVLDKMTGQMAYGVAEQEQMEKDAAMVEYGHPSKKGIYLVKAFPGGKGNSCLWYVFRWDGTGWRMKNGIAPSVKVEKCILLEEDA